MQPTATDEANHFVNIDWTFELKLEAAANQVSQFELAIAEFCPDWEPQNLAALNETCRKEREKQDGHCVESVRFATEFNQKWDGRNLWRWMLPGHAKSPAPVNFASPEACVGQPSARPTPA